MLLDWTSADDFHTAVINRDFHRQLTYLRFIFDELTFPATDLALIVGDTLHNLRSSLDILWHRVMEECKGEPSKYTRFPIEDTGDKLTVPLDNALKKKQITSPVRDFVLNTVKPYEAGNYPIWALDELNILDKHKLVIPVLQLVRFDNFCLEDDKGNALTGSRFFMDQASSLRIDRTFEVGDHWGRVFTVKNKGHASATVIFEAGMPFQGEPIVPSLFRIAEEVTRTVEAFDILL